MSKQKVKAASQRTNALVILGLGLFLFLIGAGFLGLGYEFIQSQKANQTWLITNGKVIATSISKHRYTSKIDYYTTYEFDVSYQYQVGGTEYHSQRVTYMGAYRSMFLYDIKNIQRKFPANQTIEVYYDPKEPGSSFLIPSDDGDKAMGPFLAGALFVVISLIMIIPSLRHLIVLKNRKT